MASLVYYVPLDALSVTTDADQDLFEIVAAATKRVILHGFSLTSTYTTDERIRLRLLQRTTTGSGGSAATEVAADDGNDTAATAAVATLVTTPGTAGDILAGFQWSQQGELLFLPTPEMRPVVAKSSRIALNINSAVAGTRTWSGWVCWEEA
jgi:hypothetical protein